MTKKQREALERKRKDRKPRRCGHRGTARQNRFIVPFGIRKTNSSVFVSDSPFPLDILEDSAGSVLVTAALVGCSFGEKAMIAGLIPLVLPILRKYGTISIKDLDSANERKRQSTDSGEKSANP